MWNKFIMVGCCMDSAAPGQRLFFFVYFFGRVVVEGPKVCSFLALQGMHGSEDERERQFKKWI